MAVQEMCITFAGIMINVDRIRSWLCDGSMALNPNEKFVSQEIGLYVKIIHCCYQNRESASILKIVNYIIFWFSQMAAILNFTQNALSEEISNHTTMSGIPENHMVDTKIMLFRPICRKFIA